MFNIPVFTSAENLTKPVSVPLLCWDIANLDLERRIRIHLDVEQLLYFAEVYQWQLDNAYQSFLADNCSLVITNLSKEIIWVSSAFQTMTGYEENEILGKKPSFLQGKRTNQQTREFISEKLSKFEAFDARILNYRKSGETYWCGISIFPLKNKTSTVTHFIAVEKEVS